MEKLFGIPLNDLMVALLALFGLGILVIGVLALRNRVIFKVAARNIPRRPAQTGLIVLGLMLATLLFSASFATGDTVTHSIRMQGVKDLGPVDVVVESAGKGPTGQSIPFDMAQLEAIQRTLAGDSQVKGVTPALGVAAPVVVPDTRQSEPSVNVLGLSPDRQNGFAPLLNDNNQTLSLKDLAPGQIYLGQEAARKLDTGVGKTIQVFLGQQPTTLTVAGIYKSGANPAGNLSLVLPLDRLQELTGNPGKITGVLIANQGDPVSSAGHTDAVVSALKPTLEGTGLVTNDLKQKALDYAEQTGGTFSSLFLLFGQFSVFAGILLIFLIFVMLAAERRRELGIARAIGTQRRHVVQMFVFEGTIYSLMAGLVGSFLGLGVGWAMVRIMVSAFTNVDNFQLAFSFNWRSVVISYTLGAVFTFVVIAVSAWRTSKLNIVRAVRGIPAPKFRHKTLKGLIVAVLVPVIGILMTYVGYDARLGAIYFPGVSLIIIGLPILARRFGLPDRAAFSFAGLGILVYWLLPPSIANELLPWQRDMTSGIEMFLISGIMIVLGAVWTVMYNTDVLLSGLTFLFGRFKGLSSVLKMAVTYPMQSRFRTGATLAMFSLVVFTLVVMSALISAIAGMYDNTSQMSGGFDIRANTSYVNPIPDIESAIANSTRLAASDIEVIGGSTTIPVKAQQEGVTGEPVDFYLQGVDKGYTDAVTYQISAVAPGYGSSRDVWRALQDNPGTALVSDNMVPAKYSSKNMGNELPALQLKGFYVDDKVVPELYIQVREPGTGKEQRLRVIGVVESLGVYAPGITVSQGTLNSFLPQPMPPTAYWFQLKPGVDATATARALKAQFLENGMQATVTAEEIKASGNLGLMIDNLLQGFMSLGLVVGISALGVIAARTVVERRQQIGMLRAVGFQKGMVQATFLIESSFVALLGILLGVVLGLALSHNLVASMSEIYSQGMRFHIPWMNIVLVVVVAYLASLLTTYLPARQAARIYPAEALRYE